jgi:hypothetical protein
MATADQPDDGYDSIDEGAAQQINVEETQEMPPPVPAARSCRIRRKRPAAIDGDALDQTGQSFSTVQDDEQVDSMDFWSCLIKKWLYSKVDVKSMTPLTLASACAGLCSEAMAAKASQHRCRHLCSQKWCINQPNLTRETHSKAKAVS